MLAAPGYGDATIGSNPAAADIQAALRQVYGISAITVSAGPSAGTFLVTVGGAYVSLDLAQLSGATAAPQSRLVPTLDATATVKVTLVADGTTSPSLNTVQTIAPDGTGSYLIHFVLANSQGELQDYATGLIGPNDSAAKVLAALSAILNPNNTNPALPFTDNVAVELHGTTYTVTFRGAYAKTRDRLHHRRGDAHDTDERHRLLRRRDPRDRSRPGQRRLQRPGRRTPAPRPR